STGTNRPGGDKKIPAAMARVRSAYLWGSRAVDEPTDSIGFESAATFEKRAASSRCLKTCGVRFFAGANIHEAGNGARRTNRPLPGRAFFRQIQYLKTCKFYGMIPPYDPQDRRRLRDEPGSRHE